MATNNDQPPIDTGPISTPDLKQGQTLLDAGTKQSGIWPYIFATAWATAKEGLQGLIALLADGFDEFISLLVPFLTASQGATTSGFYDLVAQLLNDLLGVEVAGSDLSAAADERGRIGAMQQVGRDLFTALGNEFVGNQPDAGPGGGPGGLPGTPGVRLTPEQGVKAAQAFIGFALSFAVRQGNVAVFTDALSVHLLGQIREYGEMMAENLGLGRLVRRALQPFIQTLISQPLQEALNRQYRPHVMDAKQLAAAYIRSEIDRSDYADRLAGLGFTDADTNLLISDTYTRIPLHDIFTLQDTGFLSDSDAQSRITALGFNSSDVPLLRQAHDFDLVRREDRAFAAGAQADLHAGLISLETFNADVDSTTLPKIEKDAIKRNGANRIIRQRKVLTLAFMKKAYLNGAATIDEYLTHAAQLGYSQDDIDLLETELLFEQSQHKAAAAAKAKAAAAKAAKSAAGNPPTTP